MKTARIEPMKGKDGQTYYRLVSANGKVLMTSEGYVEKRSRDQLAIKRACRAAGCDHLATCAAAGRAGK